MSEVKSYEAKFEYGTKQPDEFQSRLGLAPKASFVVAYDREGLPISRYGDDVWDLSAYQKNKSIKKLYFTYPTGKTQKKANVAITNEIKWILFLYWYFSEPTKAVSTLYGVLSTLRSLANYCAENRKTPIGVLNDPASLSIALRSKKWNLTKLRGVILTLIDMGETKRGFPLLLGTTLTTLSKLARAEAAPNKQYAVIPTRIYSALIAGSIEEVEKFEKIADPLLQMVSDCATYRNYGRAQKPRALRQTCKMQQHANPPTFFEMVDQYQLRDYIEQYSKRFDKKIIEVKNLSSLLNEIQSICFILINIFSGMRRGEIERLPYECLETHYENGKKHYYLFGETYKHADGAAEQTKWVTDPIIERVIKIAQKIADTIYSTINESLTDEQQRSSDYPLFIGTGYMPFTRRHNGSRTEAPYSHSKSLGSKGNLPKNILVTIEEEDILELESIDPFRNWRSEENFTIGFIWPYASHQARRSLAVYASASGLVSLQSLRRQLQHITEEMTVHYAKGSTFAINFAVGNKNHFYHDYHETKPEAQFLTYIAKVIMSDDPLFGAHGTWIAQRFDQQATISLEDRQKTNRRFNNGELACHETPIGFCTSIEPCDKRAMRTVSACLPCVKAVIKAPKLNKVIKITSVQINRLDPGSIAAKWKTKDLNELIAYEKRISKKAKI